MPPRWNWDFEDERRPRRPEPSAPPPPAQPATTQPATTQPPSPHSAPAQPAPASGAGEARRRAQIRRRRGAAAIVLAALLALGAALATGSHHGRSAAASTARGMPKVAQRHPTDSEQDQRAAVASVLSYTPFVRAGSARGRDVALTFDDGPGPYTPQVLGVLERMHVRATFFVVGRMLRYFGAATVRAVEDGDVIGDHTETHPMLATFSRHDQYEELFEQIARVELLGAPRPVLFRPPYGSFNANTFRELRRLHLLMVLWSVDTDDYAQPGVPVIVQRALEGAQPGAIILMHDAGGAREQTIAALPQIIRGLRQRGYRLVTVPQLLMDDPPPAGQQLPTNLSGG
jgi:peptidoglycan-N-acetylglucosamine deacetylase